MGDVLRNDMEALSRMHMLEVWMRGMVVVKVSSKVGLLRHKGVVIEVVSVLDMWRKSMVLVSRTGRVFVCRSNRAW